MDVLAKSKIKKELMYKLFDGCKIFKVDGKQVRQDLNCEFTGGGHGYVYPYIPKDEIWIEEMKDESEGAKFLIHEIFERTYMKHERMPYDKAHDQANDVEQAVRALGATDRIRNLFAQPAEERDENTQDTNRMKIVVPESQTRTPVPRPNGILLKEYTGSEGKKFCDYLKQSEDPLFLESLMNYIRINHYSRPQNFKKQSIPYKGLKTYRDDDMVLVYNVDNNYIAMYQITEWPRFAGIEQLRIVLLAKEADKPAKVTEIADAIRRDNPDTSDEAAYRMAWETYCSYTNPGYEGCTSKGKSHRKSPKSDYSD